MLSEFIKILSGGTGVSRDRARSSKSNVSAGIPATSIESFWVNHLTLLCLSFLICKMGIISPPHTQTGKVLCVTSPKYTVY